MRDTTGSAAAPAARCRNLRRGSFMACPLATPKLSQAPCLWKGATISVMGKADSTRTSISMPFLTRSRLQVGYLDDHQIDGFGKDGAVIAAAQATPVRQKSCRTRRSQLFIPRRF